MQAIKNVNKKIMSKSKKKKFERNKGKLIRTLTEEAKEQEEMKFKLVRFTLNRLLRFPPPHPLD